MRASRLVSTFAVFCLSAACYGNIEGPEDLAADEGFGTAGDPAATLNLGVIQDDLRNRWGWWRKHGSAPADSGVPSSPDAGKPLADAGTPGADAGAPIADAGAPPPPPPADAGAPPPPPPPPADAGTIAPPPVPTNLLPADRATLWNPGLNAVGGIPHRTTVCRTLSPSGGDDTAAIQSAFNACPAGQVVQLSAGTFRISGQGLELARNDVTLRGAGPAATRLSRTDTQNFPVIAIGRRYASGKFASSHNLAANGLKDSYSVTLTSMPALQVGELVYLDSVTNPAVSVWSARSPPGDQSRGWFGRMDRPLTQIVEVKSVSGNTVTFTTPLHIDFLTAFSAQLSRFGQNGTVQPATRWVGVEDLYVEKGRGGDGGGNIHFYVAAYSWARNIESKLSMGTGVVIDSSFRCVLRDSFIHTSADPNPGGNGYLVGVSTGAADNLIENNVIWNGNKVIVMRTTGGGNVVAYNYAQDAYGAGYPSFVETGLNAAHMTTAHHELFEGNESFNFDSDSVWGNSVYVTVFRNNFTGRRTSKAPLQLSDTGSRRAIGLTKWSWHYSFIGNVLGAEGMSLVFPQSSFVFEALTPNAFGNFNAVPMWLLGYNTENFGEAADSKVQSTVLRHGNFDYVTNSVKWATGVSQTLPDSLYLTSKPAFFGNNAWPWVNPTAQTTGDRIRVLPAKQRFQALP